MLRALRAHATSWNAVIVEQYPAEHLTGQHVTVNRIADETLALGDLDQFDVIIKSPGIPPNEELAALGHKVTSSTQIFLDTIAESGATVIGITGSKGKSTTSSLIYDILKAGGKDVHLVGNIGKPSIDHLQDAKQGTIFVLEMSSYQLMNLTRSPHVAVVTSFFPDHLDYHGSLSAYLDAKMHITRFQSAEDTVFFAAASDGAKQIADQSPGKKIAYSKEDAPIALSETKLIGDHNLQNISGAFLVGRFFGIDDTVAIEAIKRFQPLPHRLQLLGTHHGIRWIDDAISTTPESTIAALDALGDDVNTLIVGGQDRGYDFASLGKRIAASRIEHVIFFPGSGPSIVKAIHEAGSNASVHAASDMEAVVDIAKRVTIPGKICLLSTASPSYNIFKNFEDKGDQFISFIKEK